MTVKDRATLAQLFAADSAPDTSSITAEREWFDRIGDLFPPTQDCFETEPAIIGGIKGEWVRARGARTDAALLYLHGGGYAIGSPKSIAT
jgi:epsilon-lactone hydrolase